MKGKIKDKLITIKIWSHSHLGEINLVNLHHDFGAASNTPCTTELKA